MVVVTVLVGNDRARDTETGCCFLWGALLSFLILYTTIEVGKLSYCVLFTVVYKL